MLFFLNANSQTSQEYRTKAKSEYNYGRYREAKVYYDKFIELNPSDGEAYLDRAYCKRQYKDYNGALSDLDMAIYYKTHFEDVPHIDKLGIYIELKDYILVIKEYNCLIAANPNNKVTYNYYGGRGWAKYQLYDYRGAIEDLTRSIQLSNNPKDVKLEYLRRGLARIRLKDKNSGCLDYSKAGELGMSNAYDTIKKYCQ